MKILGMTLCCLILLFGAGITVTYFNGKRVIRERLSTETRLVASLLKDESDYEAFEAYYNNDELRVTVISLAGEVLFESDTGAEIEENHLDREEVRCALAGEPKTVERYSETFRCRMTYYAVQSNLTNGDTVILRLAVKSSEITSYFFVSLAFFALSFLVAIVIASTLAEKISRNISGKIDEVGASLKSLNAGQYEPLKTDAGEPEFYSVFNEINELNESTHEAMRREAREREKLGAVLDNVSQGVVALDEKKRIVFVNDSALRLFNGAKTRVGTSLAYLIEDTRLREKIEERIGENAFSFEYDLQEKTLAVSGKTVFEGSDKGMSHLLLFTDVTAEKEMIRQKSDFFANASHELKTPITVMRGLAELLLQEENLNEREKKQIERVYKESLRMGSLISDMLKISKLERSEEEEHREPIELREVALEAAAELAPAAQAKGLSVSVEGEGKVLAEYKKMFELIQNLLSNAVHYNKENGWIRVEIVDGEKDVRLRVSDGGIGIEKEHLPRLCERFYRVDKSRSKKTGGTGLGLAIVKHICVLYKAKFSIESEFGVGTNVTVIFDK